MLNDAAESLAAAFNQVQTSSLTTTTLSEVKANLQTLFDYLNENGWTDYMNQALAQDQTSLTTNGQTPTQSQVTAMYNQLVASGAAVTQTQVQNAMTITPSQAQQMYSNLASVGGWAGVESQMVQDVSNMITSSGGGRPVLEESLAHPGMAHLILVGWCGKMALLLGVSSLFAGPAAVGTAVAGLLCALLAETTGC